MTTIIRRAFQFHDKDTHLDYAIENVQKRATTDWPGMRNLTYIEILQLLTLPLLSYRRLRGDIIEVFKIIHNLYDIESSPKLLKWENVSFRRESRGHTLKLFTQRAKTYIRKNAFPIRVTEPWNSLPETVVQAKSLNTFKNRLDQFWPNQEILYNFEAPLKAGTGILKLLIDKEKDLIIEESQ